MTFKERGEWVELQFMARDDPQPLLMRMACVITCMA
jgi:hypothetical protein